MNPTAITDLPRDEILAIPKDQPERLFTGMFDALKREYRLLVSKWQPRRDGDDSEVMTHVNILHDKALEKLKLGTWRTPGVFAFKGTNGTDYEFRYVTSAMTDMGERYVGNEFIMYDVPTAQLDLVESTQKLLKGLKYPPEKKTEDEVRLHNPEWNKNIKTPRGAVVGFKKKPDSILLRDLLTHYGGKIEPRHVAWIVSRMYGVASYLQYAGLVHNAIGPDSIFVSPKDHRIRLEDWWYTAKAGHRLVAVPTRTAPFLKGKIADYKLDCELIKLTARELLGDVSGAKLLANPDIPRPMLMWARTPALGDARREWQEWQDITLKASFGARLFVEMAITGRDVYN